MKHLITITACMMLLLALIMQMTRNQALYLQVAEVSRTVDAFAEEIEEAGRVPESVRKQICRRAAEILECSRDDIRIEEERTATSAGRQIRYTVQIPVRDVLAAPGFWHIDAAANQFNCQIKRTIVSRKGGD